MNGRSVFIAHALPSTDEEGWREAPGWSVPNRLQPPRPQSLRDCVQPLLCREGRGSRQYAAALAASLSSSAATLLRAPLIISVSQVMRILV